MLFLLDVGPCAKAPKKCDIFEHTIAKNVHFGNLLSFPVQFRAGFAQVYRRECVPTVCSALFCPPRPSLPSFMAPPCLVLRAPPLSLLSVAWNPFPGGKERGRCPWDVILVPMLPFVVLSFSLFLPSKRAWLLMGPALEASCRFALADHVMFQQTNARPLRGAAKITFGTHTVPPTSPCLHYYTHSISLFPRH